MKKIPSYPKIMTKTNITVTQTQNININSPKGFPVNLPLSKKQFKIQKSNTEKDLTSQLKPGTGSKSKIKNIYYTTKQQFNNRRQSSGNLHRISKINNSKQEQFDIEQKGSNKPDYKKMQQKLKQLEKKIDTLKPQRSSKKEIQSQRTQSRIKQTHNQSNLQNKSLLSNFLKKTSGSTSKIMKKCQSDKYLIKDIQSKKMKQSSEMNTSKDNEKDKSIELINNFVTQVARTQAVEKKFYKKDIHNNQAMTCYYIQNVLQSMYKNYLMPYKEHLNQCIQTMKYLVHCRKPSLKEIERQSISLPPSKFKYSLILDLDQTLIHCNQNISLPHDVTLKIKFPTGQKIDAGVNIRPYTYQLLKELSKLFQIIVFTASHQCYANVVLDHIDPKKQLISHRLFRHQCWQTEEGVYIKDLRVIKNRNLQNILLVDNAAYSYFYQLQNGIPIIPFYDDKEDEQLLHLIHFMKTILKIKQNTQDSLQQINHKYFQLPSYYHYEDLQLMANKLYKQTIMKYKKIMQK